MLRAFCVVCLVTILCHAKPFHANFKQISLNELVKITSEITQKPILMPFVLSGKVDFISSSALDKQQLFDVLKTSLHSHGYALHTMNDFYEIKKLKKEVLPIKMEVVEVLHSDAKALMNSIQSLVELKTRKIKLSLLQNANAIVILANSREINSIKELISSLDVKPKQVYVKARIIEVNESKVNNVGIEYGILAGQSSKGDILTFSSQLNGINKGAMPFDISRIGLEIPSVSSALALGASIHLLKQNQALNIVSEPSLLCLNNAQSSIYVGETKSIKSASTITDTITKDSFEREDIGLLLNVKPRISSNGKVQLFIHTVLENVSSTNVTNAQPDTFKKEIKTTAVVDNGESVIIGGLIENRQEKGNNAVPLLSQLPLFGALFDHKTSTRQQKNLMVIITPYLIPSSQGLTYLNEELTRLSLLEEQFLQKKLQYLQKEQKTLHNHDKGISAQKRLENFLEY
jgi:general secretion pathway protein D